MKDGNTSRREYWFVVAAGSALMLFTGAGAFWIKAHAERPQILLETASSTNALPKPRTSDPDNAVGDLLRSLPPDLALDVCANMAAGAGGSPPQPCIELRAITAIAPAAPPSQPQGGMTASTSVVPISSVGPELPPDAVTAPDAAKTRTAATSAAAEPLPTPNEPVVVSVQTAEETEFDPATSSIEMTTLAPAIGQAAPAATVENDTTEPRISGNSAARAAAKAAAEAKAKAKAKAAAEAKALAKAAKAKAAARNANSGTTGTGRGKNGGTSGEGGGD